MYTQVIKGNTRGGFVATFLDISRPTWVKTVGIYTGDDMI